ncbi:hypothetical protein N7462_002318 [Penicillium macrosclerotiorum]|uniref:uncharacterized protein n=1 Tax=Penicillium macrosclerotiorum TaxID=303699 RepID=UPI002546D685|nr:uncharacterized protein N7462_002318 [Penicillium macrosclerotiorum]KAJ5692895.1 hypothetical protein N7462_002318 [Penicillium macrosclerotiorum]
MRPTSHHYSVLAATRGTVVWTEYLTTSTPDWLWRIPMCKMGNPDRTMPAMHDEAPPFAAPRIGMEDKRPHGLTN